MHIKKEGTVIFRDGEIVEINDFIIEEGTVETLKEYVFKTYKRIEE